MKTRPVSRLTRVLHYVEAHRVPMAAAAALLLSGGAWAWFRPSLITVESVPPASLSLDGVEIGQTPKHDFRVSPGEHEIALSHPKFHTFRKSITLERGGTFLLDKSLQARDPADPETIRIVANACGLQTAEVKVEVTRGGSDGPVLVPFLPRGAVREAPKEIVLYASDLAEGFRARLEEEGGAVLEEWEVPLSIRAHRHTLGDGARAKMRPGGKYRTVILSKDGKQVAAAGFEVLSAADVARVGRETAALAARFESGDPMAEVVRAEYLLGQRLYGDALAAAEGLVRDPKVGPRKEVARLGLAALDRAGLRDQANWNDWVEAWQAGK